MNSGFITQLEPSAAGKPLGVVLRGKRAGQAKIPPDLQAALTAQLGASAFFASVSQCLDRLNLGTFCKKVTGLRNLTAGIPG